MTTETIELPFKPRKWQLPLIKPDGMARNTVLVVHRRAGKTLLCITKLIIAAMTTENGLFAYCAPYGNQVKNIAWDNPNHCLKRLGALIPGVKINNLEMSLTFPNGSKIFCTGVDNPDSLRGIGLNGVVLDEVAQMPAGLFGEVIRPALSDKRGWALFIGTPKGHNHFYELISVRPK